MNVSAPIGIVIAGSLVFLMLNNAGVPFATLIRGEGLYAICFVFFGSVAVVLIRNSVRDWLRMLSSFRYLVYYREVDQSDLVDNVLALSELRRKEGPLSLEKEQIEFPFLKRGVQMSVDGTDASAIRAAMSMQLTIEQKRDNKVVEMLEFWAEVAPPFGMLGTLIGLIGMMTEMSDPQTIGPAFAVAMMTTLWGVVVAYIIAKPLAQRIQGYNRSNQQSKLLALEGIVGICNGVNLTHGFWRKILLI